MPDRPPPYHTLVLLRAGYPTPMTNDQLGELLNDTAWAHRAAGYGVLSKPGGARCQQPITREWISRDILARPDGRIFDVLIDVDGEAEPTWNEVDPVSPSRWRRPIDRSSPGPLPPTPQPPPSSVIPYNEGHAIEFGLACNDVYRESGAPTDPGMVSVHSQRAAWDYYVGKMSWPASKQKHLNEFRAVYHLPPA